MAGLPTLTLRVSYVGELGFELHHPVEHQRELYERLWEAGEPLGLVDFGYRALESMRLEKAYRLWGVDMSADCTPLEAGLERFVAFDKGDFVGREALLRQRAEGVRRTLACLTVETEDADPHGYEPVRMDGTPIGYVAAGGYGHVVEQSIALAYLPVEHAEPGTRLTVDILGEPRRRSWCRSRSTIRRTCGCSRDDSIRTRPLGARSRPHRARRDRRTAGLPAPGGLVRAERHRHLAHAPRDRADAAARRRVPGRSACP